MLIRRSLRAGAVYRAALGSMADGLNIILPHKFELLNIFLLVKYIFLLVKYIFNITS